MEAEAGSPISYVPGDSREAYRQFERSSRAGGTEAGDTSSATGADEDTDHVQISAKELRDILLLELGDSDSVSSGQQQSHEPWDPRLQDLPPHLQKWLQGQRLSIFRGIGKNGVVDSAEDLASAHAKHLGDRVVTNAPTMVMSMIHDLMRMQKAIISRSKESPVDEFVYYGYPPFDIVRARCNKCGADAPADTKARLSCLRKDVYVYRAVSYRQCGNRISKRYAQDINLRYTNVTRQTL